MGKVYALFQTVATTILLGVADDMAYVRDRTSSTKRISTANLNKIRLFTVPYFSVSALPDRQPSWMSVKAT